MHFNRTLDECKSNAGALAEWIQFIEQAKYALVMSRVGAKPIVLDRILEPARKPPLFKAGG
jgi:hypothetical protein